MGEQLVYVGNLPYSIKWQDLKDHMAKAGKVEFVKVMTEDGTEWGRSRGCGCVRFSTEEEAQNAIETLNDSDLEGRKIFVDKWTGKTSQPETPYSTMSSFSAMRPVVPGTFTGSRMPMISV